MPEKRVEGTITLAEKLVGLSLLLASLTGTAYVSLYRLQAAEAQIADMAGQVERKADKSELADKAARIDQQLGNIQNGLGAIQLDVAKMCVASLGIEKCATAGRGR
jgi:hypothetical protein